MSKLSKATEFSARERLKIKERDRGCIWHHTMLDNGNQGRREEMLSMFREYLKKHYRDWDEADLVYKKYDF